jgi:hypothetical protein
MAKRKMTKGQTTIYKTLHRILKIEQHRQWTHVLLREGWPYWLRWNHHFESFTVATMTWLTVTSIYHKWARICSVCQSQLNPFLILDLLPMAITLSVLRGLYDFWLRLWYLQTFLTVYTWSLNPLKLFLTVYTWSLNPLKLFLTVYTWSCKL